MGRPRVESDSRLFDLVSKTNLSYTPVRVDYLLQTLHDSGLFMARDQGPNCASWNASNWRSTKRRNRVTELLSRILITIGSCASIGFGIWHFFVPKVWNWYSYINTQATELIVAVRAINFFFSLSLVLFGLINISLIYGSRSNRYSILIVLCATCILWLFRVILQVIYPQGSINTILQYGMLSSFVVIFLCHAIALLSIVLDKSFG